MISPAMVKEFLLPTWIQWGEIIRAAGVPLYGMDSDGFIAQLIPFWIEAGFTHCDPMEVAAGNDINGLRNRFGRKMAFCGGIDKRAMAKGGKIIEAELCSLHKALGRSNRQAVGLVFSCHHDKKNPCLCGSSGSIND